MDDEDVILLMARHVLAGPAEPGQSSYQIELTVCERCKGGTQHGKGRALSVTHDIVEMAECDALRFRPPEESPSQGPPASVPKRAAQTIPPAVRRRVMRRHGGGCAVPGCRHAVYVDVHHVTPRAEGGTHDPGTLVVLCSAHHRALHRGRLRVEGNAQTGFVFRHADGSSYGHPASLPAADATARAFGALKQMGFKETEARRALADSSTHVGGTGGFEDVLRAALARLAGRALRVSDVARPRWVRSRRSSASALRISDVVRPTWALVAKLALPFRWNGC
jgi:hypothetical protein